MRRIVLRPVGEVLTLSRGAQVLGVHAKKPACRKIVGQAGKLNAQAIRERPVSLKPVRKADALWAMAAALETPAPTCI